MNPVDYEEVFKLLRNILKAAGFGQIFKENDHRRAKIVLGIVWFGRAMLVMICTDGLWYALKAYQSGNVMIVVVNGEISKF